MAMQTDVKAVEITTSDTAFADATRVKGLVISYEGSGTVELIDGGASGTTRFSFTAPPVDGTVTVTMPGAGIRFTTDVYVDVNDATVTVFYG